MSVPWCSAGSALPEIVLLAVALSHLNNAVAVRLHHRLIRTRVDELQKAGAISEFAKSAICAMINHVMSLIAEKYQNVREGAEFIMRGKILEYEAKTILNKGIQIGFDKGRAEGFAEGRAEGFDEGRAEGFDEGFDEGRAEGFDEGFDEGRAEVRKKILAEKEAENEEMARAMIRDRMDFSLVAKYTHLPMPRIRELARELGML